MKHKVGIDIIQNSRIKLEQNFLIHFLTTKELELLESFDSERRKIEFSAGRWAVKEAIFKVLNPDQIIPFNQMEIGYENKRPILLNKNLREIEISLSHEKDYSVGVAFYLKG